MLKLKIYPCHEVIVTNEKLKIPKVFIKNRNTLEKGEKVNNGQRNAAQKNYRLNNTIFRLDFEIVHTFRT